uniref:Uncharacterized protein n=1 Tax=Arundo donax TaxID=35708 RepID=A0A0A9FIL4_ARUDO
MLRSTLLDKQIHQDGRGGQACLTWSRKRQWTSPQLLQNNFLSKILKMKLQVQINCQPYILGNRRK